MNKTIFLMVGIPGSGKTTWVNEAIDTMSNAGKCIHISRDNIRFSMVKENEDYFAHEDKVFKEFISQINNALVSDNYFIFIDATHINEASRNKVLNRLNLKFDRITTVVFKPDVEKCLARNKKRKDRERVPDEVITKMTENFSAPTHNEKYRYEKILFIEG